MILDSDLIVTHGKLIENTPIYTSINNRLTLIEVAREHFNGNATGQKVVELKRRLDGLDCLLVEDTKQEIAQLADTYFGIALDHFKGPVHFLDEGVDYAAVLDNHGVSPELLAAMVAFYLTPKLMKLHPGDPEGFLRHLKQVLERTPLHVPTYRNYNAEPVIREGIDGKLIIATMASPECVRACFDMARIFHHDYLPKVLSHASYVPKINDLAAHHPNRAVLMSLQYGVFVKEALTKQSSSFDFNLVWQSYMLEKELRLQAAVEYMETSFCR